mgnify:CR=1 FL=1
MRALTTILLSFTLLLTSCMIVDVTTPPQENIYNIDKTKNELYLLANEWMVRRFNNAESVIQFQDKEAGKIVGKYNLHTISNNSVQYNITIPIYCIIDISTKEGAVKISIEPTGTWQFDEEGMTIYDYSAADAEKDIQDLCNNLKDYLNNNTSDW